MAVITISRQLGTLGTEIAREVAEKMNCEFVDKERMARMLVTDFKVGASELEIFDEKKPPFWEFLSFQKTKYLHSIQAAIYDFARKGHVVIVGRGGQVLLRNIPGILHVRIFASFPFRVRRLAEIEKIDEKQATRKIQQSDRDSAAYIHSFFHADWNDAALYALLINAEKLSTTTAVQLIIDSGQSREFREGVEKGKEKLADLALVQKVEEKLINELVFDFRHVEVEAEKGVVFLRGAVTSSELKEDCTRMIAAIEGVERVVNELSVGWYYGYSI